MLVWGGIILLYLASTIPVGLGLYGLKSYMGWDIFKEGGFHTYARCVEKAVDIPSAK